jgi:hypothetical protein
VRKRWSLGLTGLGPWFGLVLACAESTEAPKTPSEIAEPGHESPQARPAQSAAEPAADASPIAPPSAPSSPAVPTITQRPDPKPRNITYTVTPDGLTVDIEGARFKPQARATKLPGGAYGIEIEVAAEARDERNHTLSSPALGPLSIAVHIRDKRGLEVAKYGDRREGDGQQLLLPGDPLVLKRSWPSGEVKGPLWWGQSVRIDVGLWSLGTDAEPGRPVRKLFVVDMVADGKAHAVVNAPDVP